jgi:hypothetical protein
MAPQGEGKSILDSTEDGDEMVFEHMDSMFGNVVTVAVQRDLLMSYPVHCNAFFKFC